MALTMTEHQYGSSTQTHAWQGSILYIFYGSMGAAARRARLFSFAEPLTHGPDVATLRRQGLSLVWEGETPYLFPGSLTVASGRGKGYLRDRKHQRHVQHNAEKRALMDFDAQYGEGIGDGKDGAIVH